MSTQPHGILCISLIKRVGTLIDICRYINNYVLINNYQIPNNFYRLSLDFKGGFSPFRKVIKSDLTGFNRIYGNKDVAPYE